MEIKIVPVEENRILEPIKPVIVAPQSTNVTLTLEDIFAKFLQLEVGDGAAIADTIRSYLSVTKQYLNCFASRAAIAFTSKLTSV